MRRSAHSAALIAVTAGLAASTGVAHAGTFICVPPQAGVAVVSGGPNGTCDSVSTPVQLPSTAADQQKLLSILPYLSFNPQGLPDSTGAGKPTITVRGANLQVVKKDGTTVTPDGTGNIIAGEQARWGTRGGSNNIIVGLRQSWPGSSNLVAGEANTAGGSGNVVLGAWNTVDRDRGGVSVLGGWRNTASAYHATIAGGYGHSLTRFYDDQSRVIADGDVYSARVDERGQITAKSEPGIKSVDAGVGMTWVEFPGVNANTCTAVITPIVSGGGTVTASRYRSADGPSVLVTTTHQDKVIDTAFDIVLSC